MVFQVAAPGGLADVVYGVIAALLFAGTVIALLSLRTGKEKRVRLLVVGVIILVAGGSVFVISNPTQHDSIRVGPGSVGVSTSFFNVNVTSNQISRAYVVNFSTWNVSITSRTDGSAFGSFLSGFFTLSNGAKAEVLTTQDTNLVVVLDSGTYLILGPSDFQSFLNSFNQSVTQVSG
jgi:Bacterial PH domain